MPAPMGILKDFGSQARRQPVTANVLCSPFVHVRGLQTDCPCQSSCSQKLETLFSLFSYIWDYGLQQQCTIWGNYLIFFYTKACKCILAHPRNEIKNP